MAMAGGRPEIDSTSGLSICCRNCRAYVDRLSTYRRWPSAYKVAKARLLLPDPEGPVMTIRRLRGRSQSMPWRLWTRAPRMAIASGEDFTRPRKRVILAKAGGLRDLWEVND